MQVISLLPTSPAIITDVAVLPSAGSKVIVLGSGTSHPGAYNVERVQNELSWVEATKSYKAELPAIILSLAK